ncbi:RagB/SusD family nutrient uptake outer membrane protein [Parapedobacter pyrenivorans]|uniref:RagB/SusD family nutrient uptake outer membrane protein n=1 Tax=Parapedobacter pyrenivorans TaxID=1305674 RepID=UPI003342BBD6
MKRYVFICVLTISMITFFAGCEEFLDRPPQDQLSVEQLSFNAKEMELLTNRYYSTLPGFQFGAYHAGIFWDDNASDNMVPTNYNYSPQLSGSIVVPASGGGWSWSDIRAINYAISDISNHSTDLESVKLAYLGEFRFWRAWFYFDLFTQFGSLPWYGKPLEMDSEELFAERLPRNVIADSILADLDFAVANLRPITTAGNVRINRQAALLFKSRVALYEGTWQKYHAGTPFAAPNANPEKYFSACVDAVKMLIADNTNSIVAGSDVTRDYWNLFNKRDYTNHNEVLLWKPFDKSIGVYHYGQNYFQNYGGNTGVSKQLVDDFLCDDGLPIGLSERYQGDNTLKQVTTNRDPRLYQLVFLPGYPRKMVGPDTTVYFTVPDLVNAQSNVSTTGYQLFKGLDPEEEEGRQASTGSIIFRYAEALLNYAEAAVELGEISQGVLDETVNRLRDRVGMPHLSMSIGYTDPNWQFPSLSPLLNEVRRERRIELACEGYRFDDLMRWAATDLIKQSLKGAKLAQFESVGAQNVPVDEAGYIFPYKSSPAADGWLFDPSKHYLKPIPTNEITLNPALGQNPNYEF